MAYTHPGKIPFEFFKTDNDLKSSARIDMYRGLAKDDFLNRKWALCFDKMEQHSARVRSIYGKRFDVEDGGIQESKVNDNKGDTVETIVGLSYVAHESGGEPAIRFYHRTW